MNSIYILVIWTVVGAGAADRTPNIIKYDWRPIGEFYAEDGHVGPNLKTAKQMCEEAARQLGVSNGYRCIKAR